MVRVNITQDSTPSLNYEATGCWGLPGSSVSKETRVRSLSQEDPLEKEMANRSSILA